MSRPKALPSRLAVGFVAAMLTVGVTTAVEEVPEVVDDVLVFVDDELEELALVVAEEEVEPAELGVDELDVVPAETVVPVEPVELVATVATFAVPA